MKKCGVLTVLTILMFFHVQPGFSQSPEESKELRDELKVLKEGQKAIQKDLQEIKNLLSAKQAPPEFKETVLNIKGDQFKGPNDAKLVLVEFFDYQ